MSTLLIVDDHADNIHLLDTLLTGHGFRVLAAHDGTEALATARHTPPDLVISDILMPGMDGFALCREWRNDPRLAAIPFLFYTATYTDPRDEALALKLGADRFLVKPLHPDALLAEVRSILARGPDRKDTGAAAGTPDDPGVLRQYNQALVRKLEQKLDELEASVKRHETNERRIAHLNSVLRAVRNVNQLITREEDRTQLIRRSCENLIETLGYSHAWIALTSPDREILAFEQAGVHPNLATGLVDFLQAGHQPRCMREALASHQTVGATNPAEDCGDCPLAQDFADYGRMAARLEFNGCVFGVLSVALPRELLDNPEERALFAELASDLAFALHKIQLASHQRELERRQQRYALIVANALDAMALIDRHYVHLESNPSYATLFGRAEDRIIGHPLSELAGDGFFRKELQPLLDRCFTGETVRGRLSLDAPGTGTRILHGVFSPCLDPDGTVSAAALTVRDVTEQENLQARFVQAQKLESVGRLAGGVAHDFNNLLTGVITCAELCRDTMPPDHPGREWLDGIMDGSQRSAALVRQLLAFARKETAHPVVLDLNATVEPMQKMLRLLIGEDIELVWTPAQDLWAVRLDPGQVDQILANLCVNARDAIEGVGQIVIQTANVTMSPDDCNGNPDAGTGDYVRLTVRDTGGGLSPEAAAHLFEPFFTTKAIGQGTGLGLSTVHGIVRQNGGFIQVENHPGKGVAFHIHLRRWSEPEPHPAACGQVRDVPSTTSRTLLLVEDEESIRRTVERFLTKAGHTVLLAASPTQAIQRAAEHPGVIDLLISDVVMPGMNGRELARELGRTRPSMAVLHISGYTSDVLASRGIEEHQAGFLPKPFTRAELLRKVNEVLAG